jgi:O-methyltransferase
MPSILRKPFFFVRDLLRPLGIDMQYVERPAKDIPDRDLYAPLFSPWLSAEMKEKLRLDDPRSVVSADRKYVLWKLATQCVRSVDGDLAECGVFRGGTAYLFATIMRELQTSKRLHLFDTFAGMPDVNATHDLPREDYFDANSLRDVQDYLSAFAGIEFHQGIVPGTFAGLDNSTYCFVHIDLDIYEGIRDASAFFYERVPRGGAIVYDDYGFPAYPGARRAVDDFYATKPEEPLVLASGQCLVVKE